MLGKNPRKGRGKKYPVKGLCRINIDVSFFLYQAKNGKERQNCIVQLHEKQMCAKGIHPCLSYHCV
jgi:hypothetical protein